VINVIDHWKTKYEAYYAIGFAYANLSKFEKAIEAYEKAIEIKPDFNEAYYSIGVAYALV
jgi:tetratricopeptide (TPR) repeat protein